MCITAVYALLKRLHSGSFVGLHFRLPHNCLSAFGMSAKNLKHRNAFKNAEHGLQIYHLMNMIQMLKHKRRGARNLGGL